MDKVDVEVQALFHREMRAMARQVDQTFYSCEPMRALEEAANYYRWLANEACLRATEAERRARECQANQWLAGVVVLVIAGYATYAR